MSYTPVQTDFDILYQPVKKRMLKIEILNRKFQVLGMIEGDCKSDSFTIDSSAINRRNYQCDISITSNTYLIGSDKRIWFDKYVRPYVGIYSLRDKTYHWYLKGTFAFSDANYVYNEEDNSVSLACFDLMSMLSGDRNGRQTGLSFSIPAGEDVRTSIIGIIKVFGFNQYRIDLPDIAVQYDLEFSANATAYDMIEELMQFCPNYEFFFDIDGVFCIQRMPCYTDDITILDNDILHRLRTSDEESYSLDFKTVKNCIEIWGKEFDEESLSGFADATYIDNTYNVEYEAITELSEYMLFGLTAPAANEDGVKICINGEWTFDLYDRYENKLSAGIMEANSSYVFLYQNSKVYFLGGFQIHATFKNEIADSPFSIDNIGEEIWEIKSGTDYENITSDAEAYERAMYEAYQSNFNESLSLTLEDIPWLDVNQKVSYQAQNMNIDEPVEWLISSINGSATEDGGTINVSLVRWYPDWSEIYDSTIKSR